MKMVLQARDLWEVVSGEEVKPDTDKAGQAWDKKARKTLATIALALSAAEKEHIIDCITSPRTQHEIFWRSCMKGKDGIISSCCFRNCSGCR